LARFSESFAFDSYFAEYNDVICISEQQIAKVTHSPVEKRRTGYLTLFPLAAR